MARELHEGRRRWLRPLVVLGFLLLVVLLLVGWNRVASSPRLCASCHDMNAAAESAARSVHADVSCLACHERPGLWGSLRYLPTFAREGVATFTGWHIAGGVLDPSSCESCHTDLTTSETLKAAHGEGTTDCASCHGNVAHPPLTIVEERPSPLPSGQPHPEGYTLLHGEDVAADPGSCATCHKTTFCETCHFKSTFPHPKDWIELHGPAQEQAGAQACTLCHATTFCAGCHGTEIPHRPNWLGEHWRALQDAPVTPCLTCHPKTDCTTCHAEHGIHREQGLYGR